MQFKNRSQFTSGAILLASFLFALRGIGYGQFKDLVHQPQTMTLVRKLPPIIYVKEASFHIEASKTASVSADVVDTPATRTRGLLFTDRDRSLRLDDSNPNYTLRCKVTGFELEERKTEEGCLPKTAQLARGSAKRKILASNSPVAAQRTRLLCG